MAEREKPPIELRHMALFASEHELIAREALYELDGGILVYVGMDQSDNPVVGYLGARGEVITDDIEGPGFARETRGAISKEHIDDGIKDLMERRQRFEPIPLIQTFKWAENRLRPITPTDHEWTKQVLGNLATDQGWPHRRTPYRSSRLSRPRLGR